MGGMDDMAGDDMAGDDMAGDDMAGDDMADDMAAHCEGMCDDIKAENIQEAYAECGVSAPLQEYMDHVEFECVSDAAGGMCYWTFYCMGMDDMGMDDMAGDDMAGDDMGDDMDDKMYTDDGMCRCMELTAQNVNDAYGECGHQDKPLADHHDYVAFKCISIGTADENMCDWTFFCHKDCNYGAEMNCPDPTAEEIEIMYMECEVPPTTSLMDYDDYIERDCKWNWTQNDCENHLSCVPMVMKK